MTAGVPTRTSSALVTRSTVPMGLRYPEYRQYLRNDFIYSCAYCTMSEAEAQAIRFTIDHYEPRNARPELLDDYNNLMYSCDECNLRKGNRYPPLRARPDGYRFFRPDQDVHQDHFQRNGVRLEGITNVGRYSLEALDLNRLSLRRLREIRERLTECHSLVTEGVLGLRRFPIDRLPRAIRSKAYSAITRAGAVGIAIADRIDEVLRDYARSALIDPDPESQARAEERVTELERFEALYPGTKWRAPKATRKNEQAGKKSKRRGR
jgi:HNH endonuclease